MIIHAKQAFIEGPHASAHAKLVMTEGFQAACRAALLALVEEQPEALDPSKGWDSHSQVCGARRVLDILRTLHQSQEEMKPVKPPTLNYRA